MVFQTERLKLGLYEPCACISMRGQGLSDVIERPYHLRDQKGRPAHEGSTAEEV